MSGRTRVILADGRQVRGYRKTLRVRRRDVRLVREPAAPLAFAAEASSAEYPVRLTFLLPDGDLVRIRGLNLILLGLPERHDGAAAGFLALRGLGIGTTGAGCCRK
jgi:hypothetical protein